MLSLTSLRKRLSLPKTSWQLCFLATIGGALSAFLIVLFTLSIDAIQSLYMEKRDDYSSLDPLSRFDLPIIGAIIILFFAWLTGYKYLRTGIPLVLHRLKVAHGIMPFKNTLNQFFGSVVALGTGFSVGREGPAVHLGAACSSYIGSKLKLPHNSIRTLCACGIAAGISASFNTPIAAVIFVMEVILREYKIHIFIPVMMASIIGSLITSNVLGTGHEFEFFNTISLEHHHYPSLVLLGIFLGILAFAFNRYLVKLITFSNKYHIVARLMLAAFITGSLGYAVPYAMGTDIAAVAFALEHNLNIQLLAGLLIAKCLMTIFALGLGIPGGIVGPILGIGAIAGTCASVIVMEFAPSANLGSDFALVGMAGFMAATLNAPLAALLAVVEMSHQLEVVVPAMIVIATASVTSGQFFKNRSIFVMQLDIQGLLYREPPLEKSLQRIGVLGVMKANIDIHENVAETSHNELLKDNPQFVIVKKHFSTDDATQTTNESLSQNNAFKYYWLSYADTSESLEQSEIAQYHLPAISSQSTLAEAYLALNEKRIGAVYIYDDDPHNIIGIVTFEQIRLYLLTGKLK